MQPRTANKKVTFTVAKYKPDDAARKRKYEAAMRAKHEHEKVHGPIRRPSGPQDLAGLLARSIGLIFVDCQRDWLDGNAVCLADTRTLIEQFLRDELRLLEERVRAVHQYVGSDEDDPEECA